MTATEENMKYGVLRAILLCCVVGGAASAGEEYNRKSITASVGNRITTKMKQYVNTVSPSFQPPGNAAADGGPSVRLRSSTEHVRFQLSIIYKLKGVMRTSLGKRTRNRNREGLEENLDLRKEMRYIKPDVVITGEISTDRPRRLKLLFVFAIVSGLGPNVFLCTGAFTVPGDPSAGQLFF